MKDPFGLGALNHMGMMARASGGDTDELVETHHFVMVLDRNAPYYYLRATPHSMMGPLASRIDSITSRVIFPGKTPNYYYRLPGFNGTK